ncbi:hypothetical protein JOC36_000961 [Weissella uvarum]|uniref:hypothetical protein n=1 Tax=Weissella uvarum TaxID=1479233 RepID=UPI00195F3420|nr:hypothetical protein [Weissella uvarum]MBM7617404.1 hypothetical protein [Weissella uvarum]MCM0595711.1 hypothetical protein [Weissella uvarum]
MKKKTLITTVATVFLVIIIFCIALIFLDKKRNETVQKVQNVFFKEQTSDYKNSPISRYLKPISKDNIDMDIYAGKHKNEYYIHTKEPGIDSKNTPIEVTEAKPLLGKPVYTPTFDINKIKYQPYYNDYQVNLRTHEVTLVNKSDFNRDKRYKLWRSKHYSVKKIVQNTKPISKVSITHDKKLLYAAILNYGFNKVDIQRWKEPSTSQNGWQIEQMHNGKNYVWENKAVQNNDKKLEPNYFVVNNDSVTYHSFIVHSGGKTLSQHEKLDTILNYVNANQKSLKTVYDMKDKIMIKQSN